MVEITNRLLGKKMILKQENWERTFSFRSYLCIKVIEDKVVNVIQKSMCCRIRKKVLRPESRGDSKM